MELLLIVVGFIKTPPFTPLHIDLSMI